MSKSYATPDYSAVGIEMLSHMFAHQMRVAQAFGVAAVAANPLLANPRVSITPDTIKAIATQRLRTYATPV